MFDATKGAAAADQEIENLSDQFAADFIAFLKNPTIARQTQLRVMTQLAAIIADPDSTQALAAGTYTQATDSTGAPARALGSGSGASRITPQEALQAIVSADDADVSPSIKNTLRRVLVPTDPEFIPVDVHGTPTAIASYQRQVTSLTTERDAAKAELTNERDKSVAGSLAQRLEAATSATAVLPAGMVKKADVLAKVNKLQPLATASKAATSSAKSVVPMVSTDLVAAYNDLQAFVR